MDEILREVEIMDSKISAMVVFTTILSLHRIAEGEYTVVSLTARFERPTARASAAISATIAGKVVLENICHIGG